MLRILSRTCPASSSRCSSELLITGRWNRSWFEVISICSTGIGGMNLDWVTCNIEGDDAGGRLEELSRSCRAIDAANTCFQYSPASRMLRFAIHFPWNRRCYCWDPASLGNFAYWPVQLRVRPVLPVLLLRCYLIGGGRVSPKWSSIGNLGDDYPQHGEHHALDVTSLTVEFRWFDNYISYLVPTLLTLARKLGVDAHVAIVSTVVYGRYT